MYFKQILQDLFCNNDMKIKKNKITEKMTRSQIKNYKKAEEQNRQIAKWQDEDKKENESTRYKFFDIEIGKGEQSNKSIYFLIQYQHVSKQGLSTEFNLGDKESVKKIITKLEKSIRENR